MIFLVKFGINKQLKIFQRPQITLALLARAILLVFEKFTRAYLFQIALEIMWLPIQIARFAPAYFIYVLFSAVLVIATTRNDLFCSFVDNVRSWRKC